MLASCGDKIGTLLLYVVVVRRRDIFLGKRRLKKFDRGEAWTKLNYLCRGPIIDGGNGDGSTAFNAQTEAISASVQCHVTWS